MTIYKTLLVGSLLLSLNSCGFTQQSDSSQMNLPTYQVNPCIQGLLEAIVSSNAHYYRTKDHFYAVSFQQGTKYRYMNISAQRWQETNYREYGGILKIEDMYFVFAGDFAHDSLFRKVDLPAVSIHIHMIQDYEKDMYNKEPSLHGYYLDCEGKPIFLEVYTKGRIKEFEKKMVLPKDN